jgi:micrococcal nuclease
MDKYNQDECNYKFKVLSVEKVIDGDTIDVIIDLGFDILTRQRVRLLGIDTPESRTSDKVEKIYGNLAKKELSNWCSTSKGIELRCQKSDSRGKFGRVLGEIWVCKENDDFFNVNEWLCSNNYAVPYIGQNKEDIQKLHLQNRLVLDEKMKSN